MKYALAISSLLLAAANAAAVTPTTVALAPIDCGIVKQCINVPNDAALDVDMYFAPTYQWLNLYIGGVRYYSPTGNGAAIVGVPLTAMDGSGAMLTLSATFATYRTCTHSGRGQTCATHWNLLTGSIQR